MKFRGFICAFALVFAVFALSGCESVNAGFWPIEKVTNGLYGAPKRPEEVDIFITKKPPYDYKEVAIITYETFSSYNDEADVYRIMRERAAQAGVDGIIILAPQQFWSSPTFLTPRPRGYRYGFFDRPEVPDMFRYRASAIVKIK